MIFTNSQNAMKRLILPLLVIPFLFGACTDDTVAPTVQLGETTLAEFLENPGYQTWYTPGYESYPASSDAVAYQTAVDAIAAKLGSAEGSWKVLLVVKPNCGCQHTQREMPRVMKTLDDAGLPHEQVEVWITDTRLAGIDEIKNTYGIVEAPTFLVLKNGTETGRVEISEATTGAEISTDLAAAFN